MNNRWVDGWKGKLLFVVAGSIIGAALSILLTWAGDHRVLDILQQDFRSHVVETRIKITEHDKLMVTVMGLEKKMDVLEKKLDIATLQMIELQRALPKHQFGYVKPYGGSE